MDYEAYKAAAMKEQERLDAERARKAQPLPEEPKKESTSSLSLICAMLIAATIGFNATKIGSSRGSRHHVGKRHIVWTTMLSWVGIDDLQAYRANRKSQKGPNSEFANRNATDDMKMFINDALGPSED